MMGWIDMIDSLRKVAGFSLHENGDFVEEIQIEVAAWIDPLIQE